MDTAAPHAADLARDGFAVLDEDERTLAWAQEARRVAQDLQADPAMRATHLRHKGTWFVGVDALPNDEAGALNDVPLSGGWQGVVPDLPLHRAQLSIIYPGYPQRDEGQSAANHRFREVRHAAHVDGLLPEGPERRRFAREHHAYILGLPLNAVDSAPTLVWPRSHKIMRAAFQAEIGTRPVQEVDLTNAYHAARRTVFESGDPVAIRARPGQAFLIHRLALHGTAAWQGDGEEGRMIAFFRPEFADAQDWLHSAP